MSLSRLIADGGDHLLCPHCGAKISVEWETEYGDPVVGDCTSECPKCEKPFNWNVRIQYTSEKRVPDWPRAECEHPSVLAALEAGRIVSFRVDKDTRLVEAVEECDRHFGTFITKEQMLVLSGEIRALAEKMTTAPKQE
jgi:hypothetical protein